MTTLEFKLSLPDELAKQAREAGLLTPDAMERLIVEALRRREAFDRFLETADRVAKAEIPPMSMEEINREVKAARADRRQREAGH